MSERQFCKDCLGAGVITTRSLFSYREDWCETCDAMGTINRTGPYRLADGTWSDGVDRSKRIDSRPCSSRYEVTTGKKYSHVWHESDQPAEFDTWAEAIAYADRAARTTKNGDNK